MPCERCQAEFDKREEQFAAYRGKIESERDDFKRRFMAIKSDAGAVQLLQDYADGKVEPGKYGSGQPSTDKDDVISALTKRLEAVESGITTTRGETAYALSKRELREKYPWLTADDFDALEQHVEEYGVHRSLEDTAMIALRDRFEANRQTKPEAPKKTEEGEPLRGEPGDVESKRKYSDIPALAKRQALDDARSDFRRALSEGE